MDSTVIVLIVVVVLLLLALGAAGVMLSRRRRSERLQEHYGPEYERSLRESGDRRAAEAELTSRERRHAELDIRELRPEENERFRASWSDIQQGFVDDPMRSVHAADRLVTDIMRTRGYPVDDFDRRAEDISVAHPEVVQHYRDARSVREAAEAGNRVDTDQQRQAVTSYRALVDALLGAEPTGDQRDTDRHHADRTDTDRRDHDRTDHDRTDTRRADTDRTDSDRHLTDRGDHAQDTRHAGDDRPYADSDSRLDERAERRPIDDRGPVGHQTEERTR